MERNFIVGKSSPLSGLLPRLSMLFLYISAILFGLFPMVMALLGSDSLSYSDERELNLALNDMSEQPDSSCPSTFFRPLWSEPKQLEAVCSVITNRDYRRRVHGGTKRERKALRDAIETVRGSDPKIQNDFDFTMSYTKGLTFLVGPKADKALQSIGEPESRGIYIGMINTIAIPRKTLAFLHNTNPKFDFMGVQLYELVRHEMRHAYCFAWALHTQNEISNNCFPENQVAGMDEIWERETNRNSNVRLSKRHDNRQPIDRLYLDVPEAHFIRPMSEGEIKDLSKNAVMPDSDGVFNGPVNVTRVAYTPAEGPIFLVERLNREVKYFNAARTVDLSVKKLHDPIEATCERDAWLHELVPPDMMVRLYPQYYAAMSTYQREELKNPIPAMGSYSAPDTSRVLAKYGVPTLREAQDVYTLNDSAWLKRNQHAVLKAVDYWVGTAAHLSVNMQSLLLYALSILPSLQDRPSLSFYAEKLNKFPLEGDGLASCRYGERHHFFRKREGFRTKDFSLCVKKLIKEKKYEEAENVCEMAIEDHEAFLATMPLVGNTAKIDGAIAKFKQHLLAISEHLPVSNVSNRL